MPLGRLVVGVLLPFAAGYHLSYVFRTINALIADQLSEEIGISPAALGLLTSIYFLVMVAVQLPIGALLDRHGRAGFRSFYCRSPRSAPSCSHWPTACLVC